MIWTRGRGDDADVRPVIRGWFAEAGLTEVAFDGDPEPFGIGVARSGSTPTVDCTLPDRLFTFVR